MCNVSMWNLFFSCTETHTPTVRSRPHAHLTKELPKGILLKHRVTVWLLKLHAWRWCFWTAIVFPVFVWNKNMPNPWKFPIQRDQAPGCIIIYLKKWLVGEPTHLKNMLVKLVSSSPKFQGDQQIFEVSPIFIVYHPNFSWQLLLWFSIRVKQISSKHFCSVKHIFWGFCSNAACRHRPSSNSHQKKSRKTLSLGCDLKEFVVKWHFLLKCLPCCWGFHVNFQG